MSTRRAALVRAEQLNHHVGRHSTAPLRKGQPGDVQELPDIDLAVLGAKVERELIRRIALRRASGKLSYRAALGKVRALAVAS